jgi:hypothetical protein
MRGSVEVQRAVEGADRRRKRAANNLRQWGATLTLSSRIFSDPIPLLPTSPDTNSLHALSALDFVIGLLVTLGASVFNSAGLNITKLDFVRQEMIPPSQRRPDFLRPYWVLVRPSLPLRPYQLTPSSPVGSRSLHRLASSRFDARIGVSTQLSRRSARLHLPHLQLLLCLPPRRNRNYSHRYHRNTRVRSPFPFLSLLLTEHSFPTASLSVSLASSASAISRATTRSMTTTSPSLS